MAKNVKKKVGLSTPKKNLNVKRKDSATKSAESAVKAGSAKVEAGIKQLMVMGGQLEAKIMEKPELWGHNDFEDEVKNWKRKLEEFKDVNGDLISDKQKRVIKILKKKADYLED